MEVNGINEKSRELDEWESEWWFQELINMNEVESDTNENGRKWKWNVSEWNLWKWTR